ncbi:MAG: TIGR02301 family protein [Hyphomicrobiaceae bacterium]
MQSLACAAALLLLGVAAAPASAQSTSDQSSPPPGLTETPATLSPEDAKPYDSKLARLSEILGAVHYLRELCGQNDRQLWRERMRDILQSDGGSALRRAMLARKFNDGYRSYSRTYQSCTPTAQTAIGRYLAEGAQIAEALAKNVP